MRLTRVGKPFSADGGVKAHRGLLVVGPAAWPTIERWDVDTKLVSDRYACEFAYWTDRSGRRWKAIRILLTVPQFEIIYPEKRREELIKQVGERKALGRIYIHSANFANQLEGCIAPGKVEFGEGVGNSRDALFQIFEALGGWRENEKLTLEVT